MSLLSVTRRCAFRGSLNKTCAALLPDRLAQHHLLYSCHVLLFYVPSLFMLLWPLSRLERNRQANTITQAGQGQVTSVTCWPTHFTWEGTDHPRPRRTLKAHLSGLARKPLLLLHQLCHQLLAGWHNCHCLQQCFCSINERLELLCNQLGEVGVGLQTTAAASSAVPPAACRLTQLSLPARLLALSSERVSCLLIAC